MAGASPEEPGRTQRATRANRGPRPQKQVGNGAKKPKLVIKKHEEKTPMPLKYRCLRAAEEYRQRLATRAEALKRRNEMEWERRQAYRQEMLLLIKKQKKSKGGGLQRDTTVVAGQLPAAPMFSSAQKRQIEKPAQVAKRSPEKPPLTPRAAAPPASARPEAGRSGAARKMLSVEMQTRTAQIDVGAYTSIQEVINAVKDLHTAQEWSKNPILMYTRDGSVFNNIVINENTPWRHFLNNVTVLRCIQRDD